MEASKKGGAPLMYEDYYRNRSGLGKIKLVDFAKEYADAKTEFIRDIENKAGKK